MKIYYQWIPGAYSHLASQNVKSELLLQDNSVIWVETFADVWKEIDKWNIGVLPVENSYAGPIHENLYGFLRYDARIFGEILLPIKHCLISKENNISDIKKVFSHPQALDQCFQFLKKNNIEAVKYFDTASSVKMLSEKQVLGYWAIASKVSAEIYGLNIVQENIADQDWNTTRFFVVAKSSLELNLRNFSYSWKTSLLFQTRHIPSALYKCLWAFATEGINLTKIESMPSYQDPFSCYFWLDFEWSIDNDSVARAMKELQFFAKSVKALNW